MFESGRHSSRVVRDLQGDQTGMDYVEEYVKCTIDLANVTDKFLAVLLAGGGMGEGGGGGRGCLI